VVLLLTLAAVITPTVDVVSLAIVTGPLLVLYWISVLVARLAERRRPKEEAA
jgi:sec-independent protein translocase protein TatC